jgi:hypothetical protein
MRRAGFLGHHPPRGGQPLRSGRGEADPVGRAAPRPEPEITEKLFRPAAL